MIDTVILTIPQYNYQILNKDKFMPSARLLSEAGYFNLNFINNPTVNDKKAGRYLPRLTIRKRGHQGIYTTNLKIEFSVPKLLLGNNLEEVTEVDFPKIISKLKQALLHMGVSVYEEDLKQSTVSVFHPSKNITLSAGYTATYIIKELSKVNLTKKLDLAKTGFRNEGKALQYYSNSHSVVFYDKISDLSQPKGRAVDKDKVPNQLSIFDEFTNQEVLRFEVRLSKKQKMVSVLKELNLKSNPKFSDLFLGDVCKKVLLYYWNNFVISRNEFLFTSIEKPSHLLKQILSTRKNISVKQAVYLLGLNIICRERGVREFRQIIESTFTSRTWQRISQDIEKMNPDQTKSFDQEYLSIITKQLNNMTPFQLPHNNSIQ